MELEQRLQIKYDRTNTRYNRLWEQITNIGIFVLATIIGYIIALGSVERGIQTILTLERVNYMLFSVAVLMAFISGILSTYLIMTRKELSKLFREYKID